jgi:hypothetical protein
VTLSELRPRRPSSTLRTAQRLSPNQSREFNVGDRVWLSTKNLRKHGEKCRKLLPKYMGPFTITARIGKSAYRLHLPPTMHRLHPVFHVGLLVPYHPRPDGAEDTIVFDAVREELDPAMDSQTPVPSGMEYQRILRHRDGELDGRNVRDYLVVCREGSDTSDKWLPAEQLPPPLVATSLDYTLQATNLPAPRLDHAWSLRASRQHKTVSLDSRSLACDRPEPLTPGGEECAPWCGMVLPEHLPGWASCAC